ncbi:facilitated trehalose transporter Tret1-like isoform X2 [Prorops nasuta]|uniref:facilitated trehalose transporter Tret1-like isoform X2 n=1 Tax=Prorops nasuta TaxID=863751 RepID=UPI0034CE921B
MSLYHVHSLRMLKGKPLNTEPVHNEAKKEKPLKNNESKTLISEKIIQDKKCKLISRDMLPQITASCIVHCIVIQAGINMSYSTILTNGLEKNGGHMQTNQTQISWIASVVALSLPLGSLVAGPLMDKFGRKAICLLSRIPVVVSWILIITADSLIAIYTARVISGIAAGLTTVGLVYVSEITHPQIRSMLLCLNSVFVSMGILLPCCFTIFFDWKQMAYIFLVLELIIFSSLFTIPESPYWLLCFKNGFMYNNKISKAEYSLKWLNKRKEIYDEEYSRIMDTLNSDSLHNSNKKSFVELKNLFHQLSSPAAYKPFLILFVLFLLQQLSGAYVVIFYAISIFHKIDGTFGAGLDKNGALVMLGTVRFFMSILTAFFSKNCGRRILCIASGLGMSFSMFFSAMYLYLTSSTNESGYIQETMANHKWVLLVIILFYVCTSCLGFIIIPWTLIGELFPISLRGIGGSIMISIAYLMMFAVLQLFPITLSIMGAQGVFFFFSVISLLGTAFVYFFLPETLGKSFTDIENYFTKKRTKTRLENNILNIA